MAARRRARTVLLYVKLEQRANESGKGRRERRDSMFLKRFDSSRKRYLHGHPVIIHSILVAHVDQRCPTAKKCAERSLAATKGTDACCKKRNKFAFTVRDNDFDPIGRAKLKTRLEMKIRRIDA